MVAQSFELDLSYLDLKLQVTQMSALLISRLLTVQEEATMHT